MNIIQLFLQNLLERNSTGSGHSIAEINSCIQKLSKLACGGLLKKTEETGVIQLVFSQEDIQKAGLTRKDGKYTAQNSVTTSCSA